MNRLTRLVELRRIQEEVKAAAFGRANANLDALRVAERQLDQETRQGRSEALQDVDHADQRLPPFLYEDYYKGQAWRRQQLAERIKKAERDLEVARQAWQAAHVQVKQVEKLESREQERLQEEARRRELRVLDDIGALRHTQQE